MKFAAKVGNGPMNKRLNFGGDAHHRLDTGTVFRIRHYWEIRKVVSADCATRRCSAGHVLAGITIATMTSLRHRPTTDSGTDMATLVRCALAEVCTVPVLLVMVALCNRADRYIFILFLSLFFLSSPNLSGRRLDVYHTSAHGVALVRI